MVDYAARRGPRAQRVGRVRRLVLRSADARGRRLPGRGEPRGAARRRSPASAAGSSSSGRSRRASPGRCCRSVRPTRPSRSCAVPDRSARPSEAVVKALLFERKVARYAAARVSRARCCPAAAPGRSAAPRRHRSARPSGPGLGTHPAASLGHLRQRPRDDRRPLDAVLRPDRVVPLRARARGRGRPRRRQRAVVIEPVLGCVARGIAPRCAACARGDLGNCERIAFGHIEPGLQTGFCCDTGGGWSTFMVAHESQLHAVPDEHERRRRRHGRADRVCGPRASWPNVEPGAVVAVLGAGTLGLACIAALRAARGAADAHRRRQARRSNGALAARPRGRPGRRARRAHPGRAPCDRARSPWEAQLTGGADIVLDCVGSESSIADALAMVRPRGAVVLVGMPGLGQARPHDACGIARPSWSAPTRTAPRRCSTAPQRRTFDLAFDLVRDGAASSDSSRPPTPCRATATRSSTLPPPAGAAA